jgi:hypothetical protein
MHSPDPREDQSASKSNQFVGWLSVLDWAAILVLALTLGVFVFGGFRERVGDIQISVRSWQRLGALALLLITVRHVVVRAPALPQRCWAQVTSFWRSEERREAWPAFIATRLTVLLVGYLAVVTVGFEADRRRPANVFDNLPVRWDAVWYLSIVREGYHWNGDPQREQNVAFFPAFPVAIRAVGLFFGRQWLVVGLGLALWAFFGALLYLYRLARDLLGPAQQARTAIWALAAYPFSIYYSAPYTEAFFLLGSVGAFYHASKRQWWRAALWGFFVGLCRPNGFLIAFPVAIFGYQCVTQERRLRPSAVAAMLAPIAGILAFGVFLHVRFDDALAWRKAHEAWGRVYLGVWPSLNALWFDRYRIIANEGFYYYSVSYPYDLLHTAAAIFAVASIWPTIRRFGLAYGAFTGVNIFPPLVLGGMTSIGRITSVLFPAFIWLGAIVPERHATALIAAFCVLESLIAVLFFTWRPVY